MPAEVMAKTIYRGLSYPPILAKVWPKAWCRRRWHLFDEVVSSAEPYHYLHCDVCGFWIEVTSRVGK